MRILLDTNLILDVLLDRPSHVEASAAIWSAVETGNAEGLLAAHAVTTIYYLLQKEMPPAKAKRVVSSLLNIFGVATVDDAVLREALQLSSSGFEDAVTAAAARSGRCDYIVTRDPKGFRGSPVRSITPEALTPILHAES